MGAASGGEPPGGDGVEWTATIRLPSRFSHTFATVLPDGRRARTRVHVVVVGDDAVPRLAGFEFIAPDGGLLPDELRRPDLRGCLAWAVREEVGRQLVELRGDELGLGPGGWVSMADDEVRVEMDAIGAAATRTAGRLGRPPGSTRVTDKFLTGIVELRRRGETLAEIARAAGVHERTVRRWLAEAEARGLG